MGKAMIISGCDFSQRNLGRVTFTSQQTYTYYDYMSVIQDATLSHLVIPNFTLNVTNTTGYKGKMWAIGTGGDYTLQGIRKDGTASRFFIGCGYPDANSSYIGFATTKTFTGFVNTGTILVYENNHKNSRNIIMNGTAQAITDTMPEFSGLFGIFRSFRLDELPHDYGVLSGHKVYYLETTEGSDVTHNFKAVKRNSDNAIGFLDVVTNNFIECNSSYFSVGND